MTMPGFSAGESLYRSRGYRQHAAGAPVSGVTPQFKRPCPCRNSCWLEYSLDPENFDVGACSDACAPICDLTPAGV